MNDCQRILSGLLLPANPLTWPRSLLAPDHRFGILGISRTDPSSFFPLLSARLVPLDASTHAFPQWRERIPLAASSFRQVGGKLRKFCRRSVCCFSSRSVFPEFLYPFSPRRLRIIYFFPSPRSDPRPRPELPAAISVNMVPGSL